MRIKLAALLIAALLLASCGKKDDQTQVPPKDTVKTQQQQTQQKPDTTKQTQQKPDTTQKQQTDTKKDDDKNKDADKKKDDDKKKDADKTKDDNKKDMTVKDDTKQPLSNGDIDFSVIWPKKCAKCHGKTGTGKIQNAPDLTSSKTKSKSDAQLLKIISNGVKAENEDDDDMPSWKGKLTDDEIKAAVKYVKGL
jgi:bifunctional autolysin